MVGARMDLQPSRSGLQRRLVLAAGSALAICVVAALVGRTGVRLGDGGSRSTPSADYAVSRDDRLGPAAHAFADIGRASAA